MNILFIVYFKQLISYMNNICHDRKEYMITYTKQMHTSG